MVVANYQNTLDGQNENTIYMRRSYMYELIILFIIAAIVLTITVRNLSSDAVTNGGYVISCIILIIFIIVIVIYVGKLFGLNLNSQQSPINNANVGSGISSSSSNEGPIIRIHYTQ